MQERCFRGQPVGPELPQLIQYEPRVHILQHGYEYAPLNAAYWSDWLPTETRSLPQNAESRVGREPLYSGRNIAKTSLQSPM